MSTITRTVPSSITATRSVLARLKERGFSLILLGALGIAILTLIVLLVDVTITGWDRLDSRLWNFPSSRVGNAGFQSALIGTIWTMGIVLATCLPLGVATAIYMEEYADKERWYNRLIELNIQNLAAVPSIVYGILGLAFFVRGWFALGQSVLAAGLTLALLVLPVVIIASREAIRAVPNSLRLGAFALGATQWQVISRQVLPAAIPGIATGTILALSRAIGEAAPLLLLGALTFITFNPTGLQSAFTVMPIQIFNYISRPQEEFRVLAAAGIILLLGLLLLMNSFAIWLRNKYSQSW